MPIGSLDRHGLDKRSLVFDTWADVGDGQLVVHWDCTLEADEAQALRELADALGYLGRGESWVEAEVVEGEIVTAEDLDAVPHRDGLRPGPGWEQVSLMAPVPLGEYASWRREQTYTILAAYPLPEGKKPPDRLMKERARAVAAYPEGLLDCLTKDTSWWKRHRWSQPPGSRRVLYWRRAGSLEVGPAERLRPRAVGPVTTMLLAVTTPSGNRSALPFCTRTLPQAELFHDAVVSRLARGGYVYCPELTGRDGHGRPLRESHRHAHIIPVDLDGDRHLDHLIVHAPMGLGAAAQDAIRALRRTWTKGGVGDLQLALAGSGDLDSLRSLPAPMNRQIERILAPSKGARTWVSATPFVPPRHLKRRGVNSLAGQIDAELRSRGLSHAVGLVPVDITIETLLLRHYVRRRQRGGAPPPVDCGFALRLRFDRPVHGPICLGYASHFGLGLFVVDDLPAPSSSPASGT